VVRPRQMRAMVGFTPVLSAAIVSSSAFATDDQRELCGAFSSHSTRAILTCVVRSRHQCPPERTRLPSARSNA
jgi:hypothetical protein